MHRLIVFILQTIAALLRLGAEGTQRLADQTHEAHIQARVRRTQESGGGMGDIMPPAEPPAHWLQHTQTGPPEHWLALIREHAPHLLSEGFPHFETGGAVQPLTVQAPTAPSGEVKAVHPTEAAAQSPAAPRLRLSPPGAGYRGRVETIESAGPDAASVRTASVQAPSAVQPQQTSPADQTPLKPMEALAIPQNETPRVETVGSASPTAPGVQTGDMAVPPPPATRMASGLRLRPSDAITQQHSQRQEAPAITSGEPTPPSAVRPKQTHSVDPVRTPVQQSQATVVRNPPVKAAQSARPSASTPPEQHFDLPRWAAPLDEDESREWFTPPATVDVDAEEHRRRLDREQRGDLWNG